MNTKGQVIIPRHIRMALNVGCGSKFLVSLDENAGFVELRTLIAPEELSGSLRSDVVVNDSDIKHARKASWGSRWAS